MRWSWRAGKRILDPIWKDSCYHSCELRLDRKGAEEVALLLRELITPAEDPGSQHLHGSLPLSVISLMGHPIPSSALQGCLNACT